MQSESDATVFAVLVASLAVPRVQQIIGAFGAERQQAEPVGDELVGEHRGVGFHFDEINGNGGDLGQDGAAQRVGKGQVDVLENKVDV